MGLASPSSTHDFLRSPLDASAPPLQDPNRMHFALPMWAIAAALVSGYALLMATNPVRASLRDGARAVRRYPALGLWLGLFGCGYAAFHLTADLRLQQVGDRFGASSGCKQQRGHD